MLVADPDRIIFVIPVPCNAFLLHEELMYVSTKELPHCLLVMGKMPLAEVSFVTQESLVVRNDVCASSSTSPPSLNPGKIQLSPLIKVFAPSVISGCLMTDNI